MRNTLQEQYNLLKEGKMNKQHFFKSARHLFPDLITPTNSFTDAVTILKNRGVISEGIGGLVTTGKKQDWHAIFNENIAKLKENSEEEKINKLKDIMAKAEKGDTQATQTLAMLMADIPGLKEGEDEDEDAELARRGDEYAQGMEDIHVLPNKGNLKEEEQIKNIEQNGDKSYTVTYKDDTTKTVWCSNDAWDELNDKYYKYYNNSLTESKEVKAIEKETTKEVTDMATRGYDYKDEKNYDNVFGQEFLQGYYTEMKDPKNADKHVDELRAIVAKNLAKDINHYVKDGQFGVKGVGYTTEAPGLGEPKEAKGKYKSSGYGDLKESVLRLAIQDIIKEILVEEGFKAGDYVKYDGKAYRVKAYYKMSDKYDLEDSEDDKKILKNISADKVSKTTVKEALDKDSIKQEGEDAKKNAMKRRITNEIVRRKKKMKALQTLTELEDEDEEMPKKLKELQSEIKQLEGMAAKLDSKKKEKEAIEEEVPQMKNIEDEEAKKEVELANILAKKANLLKQPGTQS